jgi:hypothetical protein
LQLKRNRARRAKERGFSIQKAATAICQSDSADRITAIAEALAGGYGGLDRLVKDWHETHEEARRKGRHRRITHMHQATLKLLMLAEELNHRKYCELLALAPDQPALKYAVGEHPQIAATALEQAGWTCEPPAAANS